jgi:hypothetical protein
MEDLLTNAFSTGDLKVIVVAAILYIIIYFQRKDTKAKRDDAQESMDTRVKLLESEIQRLKDLDLDARLASIETSLKYIQMLLEGKQK